MIEGSLRNVPLGDVFGIVATGQKAGVLTVRTDTARARVHFENGRVLLAHARPGVHLAEMLVRREQLTVAEALALLDGPEADEARFGAAAVAGGHVDEEALHAAVGRQAVETLAALLDAGDGHFAFAEREANASQAPVGRSHDAMSLLMAAASLVGERGARPADPDAFFECVGDPTAHALPEGAWELLEQTDGRRSARAVVADTDLGETQGFRLLGWLEDEGVLAPLAASMPDPPALVVSGSFARSRLVRLVLHRSGVRTVITPPGETAEEVALDLRPKFFVMDDPDGAWKSVRALRRLRGLAHVPAVVLAANGTRLPWWRPRPRHAHVLERAFEEAELHALAVRLAGRTLG